MTRKYSSTSVEQLLNSTIGAGDTTLSLASTAAVTALLGGVTLAGGNVDQFTIAIDPDTSSEEIIFVRGTSGATLTGLVRGQAGTSATTHTSGATIKHVLTSDDLDFYTTGVATANAAVTLTGTQTLTNKTISSGTLTGTLTAGGGAGTSGQFLQSTGTGVQWAAGGGMTSLATGSLSGGTVTISSIPSTYNDLRLVIRNFKPANDNQQIELRFNGDSNTRYSTVNNGDGTTTNQPFGNTSASLYGNNDNSVATGLIVVEIPDYANTATWKFLTSNALSVNSTTTTNWNWYPSSSFYNQTAAISSITLFPQTGNFTSGDYILYGVK